LNNPQGLLNLIKISQDKTFENFCPFLQTSGSMQEKLQKFFSRYVSFLQKTPTLSSKSWKKKVLEALDKIKKLIS